MDSSGSQPPAAPAAPQRRNRPSLLRPPSEDDQPSLEESLRDAEHRSLDFPAQERAAYIRSMVTRAQELKRDGRTYAQIREVLPEFARDYPYLFDMVTQEAQFDQANLTTMLAMLDRMGAGNLNHHQATVIVGQRLAQKYISKDGKGK